MQFSVLSLFALCGVAMAASIDPAVVDGLQKRQTGPPVQEATMRNDEDGEVVRFSNPDGEGGAAAAAAPSEAA